MTTQPARNPARTSTHTRTWATPRCWMVLLLVLALGLTVDLWSKSWAFEHVAGVPVAVARHALLDNPGYDPIPMHESQVVIPGRILNLHLVLNSGAVFGIGSDQRSFFVIFTLVAISVALYVFGWRTLPRSTLAHVGIALVLAGALGNLWDRLAIGRVRDFLHLFPNRHLPFGWHWPGSGTELFPWVFNVADVMLLSGMGILLIHLHLTDRQARRTAQAQKATPAPADPSPPTDDSARH